MSILIGIVGVETLLILILLWSVVLLLRRLNEAETARDTAVDFLEREGIVWSDVSDDLAEELAYSGYMEEDVENDPDARPGHEGRWDESKTGIW